MSAAGQAEFYRSLVQVRSDDPAAVDAVHQRALAHFGEGARWRRLAAMAFDRARALAGREQKFGTQFVKRAGVLQPWPVDRTTTDSERAKWGIAPLTGLGALADHGLTIDKAPLRRLLRARRQRFAADAAAAAAANARLSELASAELASPELAARAAATGAVVGAYWPLPGEADPLALAQALAARGATLALPVVDGDTMHFRRWQGSGQSLVDAGFGTRGPGADAPTVVPTIVLAPLLGFDRDGCRLGQGRGYYDRWLAAAAPRPFVLGIGFACQELPAVPTEAHDLPLDAVATELGVQAPGRR